MIVNEKTLTNQIDVSHNSMSFLDDLSLHIANVSSIKLESFDDDNDKLSGGCATHEINDMLNFFTTSNESDNMANLDFLNDELALESQPQSFNFDDTISTDVNFNICDPESMKSDCMWSSTLGNVFGETHPAPKCRRGRKRDFSMTFSECAEGMSGLATMDMLSSTPPMPMGGAVFEGALWTPLNSCNSETDSDEEIDVETPYASPLQQPVPRQLKTSVEPGIFPFSQFDQFLDNTA